MYVECPHCHAIFALPAGLEAAPERVRCGECNTIFTPQAESNAEEYNASTAQSDSKTPLSIDDFLTDGTAGAATIVDEPDKIEPSSTASIPEKAEGPIDEDIMESFQSYLDEDSYPKGPEKELPDLNAGAAISPVENDPLANYQANIEDSDAHSADDVPAITHTETLQDDESSNLVSERFDDNNHEDDSSGRSDSTGDDEQAENALPVINDELIKPPEEVSEETEAVEQETTKADSEAEEISDLVTDDSENISEEDKLTLTGEFQSFIEDVDSDPIDLFSSDKAESIYEQQFLSLEDEPDTQQADLLNQGEAAEQTKEENPPIAELNQLIDESDAKQQPDDTSDTSLSAITESTRTPISAYLNSTWFYTLIGLILILTLATQYLHAHPEWLATYPKTRPLMTGLCKVTGCNISPQRDLAAIELLNHGIYAHPTAENALIIKALIRNKSEFAQPYPSIELTLADLNDRKIALRRFGPGEYLSEKPTEDGLMPVNKNVPVYLQVLDPGQEAVAFEFEFL